MYPEEIEDRFQRYVEIEQVRLHVCLMDCKKKKVGEAAP